MFIYEKKNNEKFDYFGLEILFAHSDSHAKNTIKY